MLQREFDAETLREVFVYLYRCWLCMYLEEDPVSLALSATDGVIVARHLSLYYSTTVFGDEVLLELQRRLPEPLFVFAPVLPKDAVGLSSFDPKSQVQSPLSNILELVDRHWAWLSSHKERALKRQEIYERRDGGRFGIWRHRSVTRLILHSEAGEKYGYVVIRNAPNDYFLRKSRSCAEQGDTLASGQYKRTDHRVDGKTNPNLDLVMDNGSTLLLRLVVAGAGYKAFPRQTPEPQFNAL